MNEKRKAHCLAYLEARKAFRDFADKDEALRGNDNIIGRIGEAIAHSFLKQQGRNPVVEENQTKEGYDILCDNDKNQRVSVKTITSENKAGGTTKINDKYDELILVSIDNSFKVNRLGHIYRKDFLRGYQLSKKYNAKTPYFRKSMLDSEGLIAQYGKLYTGSELDDFDLLM